MKDGTINLVLITFFCIFLDMWSTFFGVGIMGLFELNSIIAFLMSINISLVFVYMIAMWLGVYCLINCSIGLDLETEANVVLIFYCLLSIFAFLNNTFVMSWQLFRGMIL